MRRTRTGTRAACSRCVCTNSGRRRLGRRTRFAEEQDEQSLRAGTRSRPISTRRIRLLFDAGPGGAVLTAGATRAGAGCVPGAATAPTAPTFSLTDVGDDATSAPPTTTWNTEVNVTECPASDLGTA